MVYRMLKEFPLKCVRLVFSRLNITPQVRISSEGGGDLIVVDKGFQCIILTLVDYAHSRRPLILKHFISHVLAESYLYIIERRGFGYRYVGFCCCDEVQ